MPKELFPKIDPCSDCPVPPRFITGVLPNEAGVIDKWSIECRECGESWSEPMNEE
jgi:hypothetical protein